MKSAIRLTVLAKGTVATAEDAPSVPGFAGSNFGPMVLEAVRRCLGDPQSDHLLTGCGDRTGLVLCSGCFDTRSLKKAADQVSQGRVVDPLLFHQTVPTTIVGLVACEYRVTGPVCCLSACTGTQAEALAVAELLIADDAADWMVVVAADLNEGASADLVARENQVPV